MGSASFLVAISLVMTPISLGRRHIHLCASVCCSMNGCSKRGKTASIISTPAGRHEICVMLKTSVAPLVLVFIWLRVLYTPSASPGLLLYRAFCRV